jgi:hypothetical protein
MNNRCPKPGDYVFVYFTDVRVNTSGNVAHYITRGLVLSVVDRRGDDPGIIKILSDDGQLRYYDLYEGVFFAEVVFCSVGCDICIFESGD